MVFAEINGRNARDVQPGPVGKKAKELGELEDEFGMNFRPNEGEAAEHGVFYDDTKYDYMQHMKDLGSGNGQVTWVPAASKDAKAQGKGKNKMSLDDALRNMDLGGSQYDDAQSVASSYASQRSLLPDDALGSEFVKKTTYQDMQDIPDAIAGFQPDMDPRLREVLEALEDEAYVNDEEEDFFAQLAKDGEEVDRDDWEASGWDDEDGADGYREEDDGWASDDTVKPEEGSKPRRARKSFSEDFEDDELPPPADTAAPPPSDPTGGAWIEEFAKFKQAVKEAKAPAKKPIAGATPSEQQSVNTGLSSLASGRRKKRKGAMTNPSAYSMSSSALARTDAQTLLDQRFDKIEEEYADGYDEDASQFDDAESVVSGMTGMTGMSRASHMSKMSGVSGISRASGISTYSKASDSEAPELVRSDFDSIMDGFLAGHSRTIGRGRRIKKSGYQTGMEQLDEVRQGLGSARLTGKAKAGLTR